MKDRSAALANSSCEFPQTTTASLRIISSDFQFSDSRLNLMFSRISSFLIQMIVYMLAMPNSPAIG